MQHTLLNFLSPIQQKLQNYELPLGPDVSVRYHSECRNACRGRIDETKGSTTFCFVSFHLNIDTFVRLE